MLDPDRESAIRPVYPLTQGLTNKMICTNMRQALKEWGIIGGRAAGVGAAKYGLCRMRYAYENIHFPASPEALELAREAAAEGEVPVGCVIVQDGRIIGRGRNRREEKQHTSSHAEMEAIRQANEVLGTWRLDNCTLYVTLEPCQMCSGAIVQARIPEVVIGCMNPKAGCAGSILNILQVPDFNHQVRIVRGIMEEECSAMLTGFLKNSESACERSAGCER